MPRDTPSPMLDRPRCGGLQPVQVGRAPHAFAGRRVRRQAGAVGRACEVARVSGWIGCSCAGSLYEEKGVSGYPFPAALHLGNYHRQVDSAVRSRGGYFICLLGAQVVAVCASDVALKRGLYELTDDSFVGTSSIGRALNGAIELSTAPRRSKRNRAKVFTGSDRLNRCAWI